MRISNENKTRTIELIKIESVKEHYPSYKIRIKVDTENIKTDFDNFIWISETDIDTFLKELEILDRERKGEAVLNGMSPNEFSLVLKPIDLLGHLSIGFKLVKEDRIDKDYSYDIKVDFQIDPTILPKLIADFKTFVQ